MRKNKKSPKDSTLKNDLLDGLLELLLGFIIIALALVLAILLPTKSNVFELYMLIASIIFALAVGIGVFIHLLVREIKKTKNTRSPKADTDTDEEAELVYPAHQMKLRPAPFAAIQSGHKTLELRLNDGKRQKIKVGDTIVFTQTETGETLRAVVLDIHKYPDFEAMYAVEDPVAMGYNEGETADPKDMSQYYKEDEIKRYGTLAIEIKKIEA